MTPGELATLIFSQKIATRAQTVHKPRLLLEKFFPWALKKPVYSCFKTPKSELPCDPVPPLVAPWRMVSWHTTEMAAYPRSLLHCSQYPAEWAWVSANKGLGKENLLYKQWHFLKRPNPDYGGVCTYTWLPTDPEEEAGLCWTWINQCSYSYDKGSSPVAQAWGHIRLTHYSPACLHGHNED